MNSYAFIILIALLANFLIDLWAEILNLGALNKALPPEVEDIYDQEQYAKSQAYTKAKTRFGLITSTFDLLVLLGFWFCGGFNAVDQFLRHYQLTPIWTGLLYIGLLTLVKMVIGLPFSVYGTFVLEERFGFNRTTPKTFILDYVKGIALAAVLGGLLLGGVLAIFEHFGAEAWLYCWLAVTAFTLIVQFIAPTWIMPLFNKFEPLEEGELRREIMGFARKVEFPLDNVYVMDGSKRSSKANAFFTGFGRHKRIALFDTLIAKHTVPQLMAILAHEVGHYKKKHILMGVLISIAHTGIMLYLLSFFLESEGLFAAFFMEEKSVYAGLIFFSLLLTPLELVLGVLMSLISRRNEYQADRFAIEHTGLNEDFVRALKVLSADNLANLTPHPFYVFLHYSHPPLVERVRAIAAFKNN